MVERNVEIESLFEPGSRSVLEAYLRLLHPADIAELFDFVDEEHWPIITRTLSAERLAEVMSELDDGQLETLGEKINLERLIQVVEELETDDAADMLQELPDEKAEAILDRLEDEERDELETLLAYPEDSAGGLMQVEVCQVNVGLRVVDAIEAVRLAREDLQEILELYIVDDHQILTGTVALQDLVLCQDTLPLVDITHPVQHCVTPEIDQEEVAQLFSKYDLKSLPVVDSTGVLLGRITFDDIQDVVEEEATEDVMVMAGASSEELVYGNDFVRIAIFRLPWLISSLLGSLLTTVLVPMFSTIAKDPGDPIVLVLASFVPVVMAMTGNVGSQTAMIITRGLAIGKVELSMMTRTLTREVFVGMIMGISAGILVGIFSFMKNGDPTLGLTLTGSMICSMTLAAVVGALAPAVFKKIGIDPAIAAGPLVTTGCDVLGVAIYLLSAILMLS